MSEGSGERESGAPCVLVIFGIHLVPTCIYSSGLQYPTPSAPPNSIINEQERNKTLSSLRFPHPQSCESTRAKDKEKEKRITPIYNSTNEKPQNQYERGETIERKGQRERANSSNHKMENRKRPSLIPVTSYCPILLNPKRRRHRWGCHNSH
ncbi:hypothetical protein K440DRAFT_247112 [Wilcoxina mikolae CBS 423.85]|nr:hypothetical protein K440DRAFT_247112 [Wilcoxina mikolae CBS 423.85]